MTWGGGVYSWHYYRIRLSVIPNWGKFLQHQNEQLRDNHAHKHSQRIDCGIAHRRRVALDVVGGISERHRVGHGAAKHAARLPEVEFEPPHRHYAYDDCRHNGKHGSERNPGKSLRSLSESLAIFLIVPFHLHKSAVSYRKPNP